MTTVGLEPTTSRLEVHTSTTELPSPDALLAGKSVCATTHIYIVAPAGRDLFFAGRVLQPSQSSTHIHYRLHELDGRVGAT